MGQINSRVGDFDHNVALISKGMEKAKKAGVDLMVFPEMALTGYPPRDLAFRGSFIKASEEALERVVKKLSRSNMTVIVGGIENTDTLYNAAAVIHRGRVLGYARKRHLFCCGSFDETRYFSAGQRPFVIRTESMNAVVTLGDDYGYPVFPGEVELLVNLWNEPYHYGHRPLREQMMIERAREEAVAIALAGPVGGQDEMIFEGSSKIVDGFGEILARGKSFQEDLVIADLDLRMLKVHRQRVMPTAGASRMDRARVVEMKWRASEDKKPADPKSRIETYKTGPEEIFTALVASVRDYFVKNDMKKIIVGVSGGIDSALTLVLAAKAAGPKKVMAISMPGPYTSKETRQDARALAENLGVVFHEIPIANSFRSMLNTLAPVIAGTKAGVTEENLQARVRGQILMSAANKLGGLVLATSNKSEAACGYCTLYGDTCGGFAPLVDVYKTQVYEIAEWLNESSRKPLIPKSIIERPPTAELRPGQTDQDTLPPYPRLDRILSRFLERGMSLTEIIEAGEDPAVVEQVLCMLMDSSFKRTQSPMGPVVSERPLSDLRLPLTKRTGWWFAPSRKGSRKSCKAPRE